MANMVDPSDPVASTDNLVKDATLGNQLVGELSNIPLPDQPAGQLRLYFESNAMSDLWIALSWL